MAGAVALVLAASALAACGDDEKEAAQARLAKAQAAKAAWDAKVAAAAKADANEAGDVPVLMYHRIVDHPGVPEDRSPAQFRADLERLAREGYVPITAAEYVSGRIAIPAGAHPVVLTFDDSSASQLELGADGVPDKDSAAGIIRSVAAAHPGFRPVATYFVTRDMFQLEDRAEQRRALEWLGRNGFEIGNHTKDHLDLSHRPKDQVAEQVASGQALITGLGAPTPTTLALPYGNEPRKARWADHGTAAKTSYDYAGVFLAGYTPSPSPFARRFDPLAIPRIRAGGTKGDCAAFCSTGWLDNLKQHPADRYTSDGDPATVTVPAHKLGELSKSYRAKAIAYKTS